MVTEVVLIVVCQLKAAFNIDWSVAMYTVMSEKHTFVFVKVVKLEEA